MCGNMSSFRSRAMVFFRYEIKGECDELSHGTVLRVAAYADRLSRAAILTPPEKPFHATIPPGRLRRLIAGRIPPGRGERASFSRPHRALHHAAAGRQRDRPVR